MSEYVLIAGGIKRGGNRRYLESSDYFSFVFDSTSSINFNYTASVTSHPVDSKSVISDHIVNQNDTFSITGVVSNTPLEIHKGNIVEYTGDNNLSNRWQQALAKLKQIKEAGEVIIIATEFDILTDCVITRVSGNLTPESVNALEFSIDLQKIKLVDTESIALPPNISSSIKAGVQGTKSGGEKKKEDASEKAKQISDACIIKRKYYEGQKKAIEEFGRTAVGLSFTECALTSVWDAQAPDLLAEDEEAKEVVSNAK